MDVATITRPSADELQTVLELRSLAVRGLARMYDQPARQFVFCLRQSNGAVASEGLSDRYTAITAIGLAAERPDTVQRILGGTPLRDVVRHLADRAESMSNLGDVALTAWAASVTGCAAEPVWDRLRALGADTEVHPTVEVAWALSALSVSRTMDAGLAERLAQRLRGQWAAGPGLFPHRLGGAGTGVRDHVACFADQVYPTLALAQFGAATGDQPSVACAAQSAASMCERQGPAGQWWWHFDYRTGRVIEGYPVYAVHQDAMAPMALFAAAQAAGTDYSDAIARGLAWLWSSPELAGRSLVDRREGLIWRKVARREPAKLSRYVQAAVSRVSPHLRAPGLDPIFPPTAIDFEDRPYHLGWLLHAWPEQRAAAWSRQSDGGGA